MRKVIGSFLATLMVLFWAGYSMAGSPLTGPRRPSPKNVVPHIPPNLPIPKQPLQTPPSIKTDLRWDFVRYVGRYSRYAIVRITATFTNVGGMTAQCPDPPCRAVLREYEEGHEQAWLRVLGYKDITTLASGQSITITKDVKVYCADEFPNTYEAFHDVKVDNPNYYIYHDSDYLRPSKTKDVYDSNLNDNWKKIKAKDIMNALWGFGCTPRR